MKTPKISVIMPIYNVEEYLEDALDCLLNQSMIDDMEVLMIDDGSTDDSRYIIEKYALDYDNFYAYHKENEGLPLTRNFGIDLAKGEYIHFFDSDDNVAYNGYEKLYEMAKKNDSDIVTSYGVRLRPYAILDSIFFKKAYANIPGDVDNLKLEDVPEILWDIPVWNKLFKKEFIDKHDLKFIPERILYEDGPFTLKSYALADKISVSKDLFYYWRVRSGDNKTITQQHEEIDNFRDRMKILSICHGIINEEGFSDNQKNELYFKWINYDLQLYLNHFNKIDSVYYQEIFDKINDLLSIIPEECMKKLNSSKKIMYEMIKNNDIGSLIYFIEMHNEIKKNPHIPEKLDEKYSEILDLEKDGEFEELVAKGGDTSFDEENIYLEFSENIDYLNDEYPHETIVKLIDSNDDEYPLEIDDERKIIIPISLIKDKSHMRIRVEYIAENFKKESFLTNKKRQIIEFDDFDVELGKEENLILFINIRPTDDLNLRIQNIIFEEDILKFAGKSNKKITTAYIENVVTLDKIEYPIDSVEEDEDNFDINFEIPYEDILSYPVRKWELKVGELFKTIKVNKRYEFYKNHNKLYFINTRNKVLISDDFHNALDTLEEYNENILSLKRNKNKLTKTNNALKTENIEIKNENKSLFNENKSLFDENKSLFTENKTLFNENKSISAMNEKLTDKNKALSRENNDALIMNTKLKNRNADLVNTNAEFEELNKKLSQENTEYKAQNEELTAENTEVKAQNEELTAENTEVKAQNKTLTAENTEIKAKNASLKQKIEKAKKDNIEVTKELGKTIDQKDEMEKIIEEYESQLIVKSMNKVKKIF